jgi:hypothetical protein
MDEKVSEGIGTLFAIPVSLRCPKCMHIGVFGGFPELRDVCWHRMERMADGSGVGRTRQAGPRWCPNSDCLTIVFVIIEGQKLQVSYPAEVISFEHADIPEGLVLTLREAISCHAAGAYRASAMIVRRLLEEICAEAKAEGKDLHHRLLDLRSKITLPVELFEAMSELKALGNDAAHVEARAYDEIGPEEAKDSIELAKEILKSRFQLGGLVARLRSRKSTPIAP